MTVDVRTFGAFVIIGGAAYALFRQLKKDVTEWKKQKSTPTIKRAFTASVNDSADISPILYSQISSNPGGEGGAHIAPEAAPCYPAENSSDTSCDCGDCNFG